MKSHITFILLILFIQIYANNLKNCTKNIPEYKTFIVKTNLSKEELEELLSKNVSNINEKSISQTKVQEIDKEEDNLKKTIERQNKEEAEEEKLIPPVEFIVKEMKDSNNNKGFITKEENKNIVPLYKKIFGNVYTYIALVFIIFIIIYLRKFLSKKKENFKRNKYNNFFDTDSNEYMLAKLE